MEGTKRIEREVRCFNCNKLFTRVIFTVSFDGTDESAHTLNEFENNTISELIKNLEVKVGLETKCRGCKQMDNKVFVV